MKLTKIVENQFGSDEKQLTIPGIITVILSIIAVIFFLVTTIWGMCALYARYSVWSQGKAGQAELQRADWNRRITIKEALAKKDAAVLLAEAEIERAKGVAQANKIIGHSLQNNEAYLRYLWIDHLQNESNQVIYVPTEANLPILEANRLNHSSGK